MKTPEAVRPPDGYIHDSKIAAFELGHNVSIRRFFDGQKAGPAANGYRPVWIYEPPPSAEAEAADYFGPAVLPPEAPASSATPDKPEPNPCPLCACHPYNEFGSELFEPVRGSQLAFPCNACEHGGGDAEDGPCADCRHYAT